MKKFEGVANTTFVPLVARYYNMDAMVTSFIEKHLAWMMGQTLQGRQTRSL